MEKLSNWFASHQPKRILDMASGAGNFIHLIQSIYDDFDEVIGIDSLSYAVNSASKNFADDERVRFVQMKAEETSFQDHSFDLITLSNSLHHLDDPSVVFDEMNRLLVEGGHVLISEMVADHLSDRQISHLKLHHFAAEIDRYLGDTHNETYNKQTILDILSSMPQTMVDSWELTYERSTANEADEIEWLCSTVDRLINRIQEPTKKQEFTKRGESIKDYIRQHGFDSATTLIVVMKR